MATAEILLTAEEYQRLPDNGLPTELVRGRIVPLNMPFPRHGLICANIIASVQPFLRKRKLGRVMSNDSGVITERGPDTVRGADVMYYSYRCVPKGRFPKGYLAVSPDVVFEVHSTGDTWKEILAKVKEYLKAKVLAVCALDDQTSTIRVYRKGKPVQVFGLKDDLTLPELHPDFRAPVRRFFDES